MVGPQIIIPALILLITLIIAFVIIQFIKNRRKERSQMIENGMNPFRDVDIESFNKMSNLRNGILLFSLGVGLAIAQLLLLTFENLDGFITYLTSTTLVCGVGFLITYKLIKRP